MKESRWEVTLNNNQVASKIQKKARKIDKKEGR